MEKRQNHSEINAQTTPNPNRADKATGEVNLSTRPSPRRRSNEWQNNLFAFRGYVNVSVK
jgi:hypothetical protein